MKYSNAILIALFALMAACERSDVITGVGEDAVSGMDPSLTDMKGGFLSVALDTSNVSDAFSLPAAPLDTLSTRFDSHIYIGISGGDTLAAHMQYRVAAFDTTGFRYTSADSLVSAYLYFHVADTIGTSQNPIAVALCDTLIGLAPVNRSNSIMMNSYCPDTIGNEECLKNHIEPFINLGAEGTIDSMPLPKSVKDNIFNTRTSIGKDTAYAFAFSIPDYLGNVRKIQNPYIVLTVHRPSANATVRDSINGFSRVTTFENAESAAARATMPYTSFHTQRTAVFKIDIRKIADSLRGRPSELLNAVILADTMMTGTLTAGGASLSRNYKIVVLDTLLTNTLAADSADAANLLSLYDRFKAAEISALVEPQGVHSIKTPMRKALTSGKQYIYVYLRAVSEHGIMLWDDTKIKVVTVFTPSRQ